MRFSRKIKKNIDRVIKFVRSRQPGIISLMSYSLLWFVKINRDDGSYLYYHKNISTLLANDVTS